MLYGEADPAGVIISGPGLGPVSAAGILGRLGDATRFDSLRGVRSFTGLVPTVSQSGEGEHHNRPTTTGPPQPAHHNRPTTTGPPQPAHHDRPTTAGDPGLRDVLFTAADSARETDPTLAARYHDLVVNKGKHHNAALCTLAAVLVTRLAACWRTQTHYILRDTDGTEITPEQGREICATRHKVTRADRAKTRTPRAAQRLKRGTGRRNEESHSAPASSPSTRKTTTHQNA